MQRLVLSAILLLSLLLVGCDSVNVRQYRISSASRADGARAKRVLGSIAGQLALLDRTSISRAADTLVFYTQPGVEHFAIELGARRVGGDILVDLSAGFGPTPREYVTAERLLIADLEREFGSRVTPATHPDTIHSTQ